MSIEWAEPYVNGVGQVKWQPKLPDGRRKWAMEGLTHELSNWTHQSEYYTEPALYGYRRAVRIAKAEHHRRQGDNWKPVHDGD